MSRGHVGTRKAESPGNALPPGGGRGRTVPNPIWQRLTQTPYAAILRRQEADSREDETAGPCADRGSQPVAAFLMAAGRAGRARTFGARLSAAQERSWAALSEACRNDPGACTSDEERRLSRLHGRIHAAMDASAPTGTAVYAPIRGVALPPGASAGYGTRVYLLHDCPPDTSVGGRRALTTLYAHLERSLVTAGQRVNAGEQIGTVGTSGRGEGNVGAGMAAHLHFSVQAVPREGPPREMTSGHEERRDIRIRPDVWLSELGVAVSP